MGAVFCDDATPHGAHQAPTDTGRCPGRGLQEQRALMDDDPAPRRLQDVEADRLAEVCVSCGREQHRTPAADCDQPEWHDTDPAPVPEPALQGADLVAHLQRDRATVRDQLEYATQLLTVLAVRAGGELRVTVQELEAVDGMALRTWHDRAGDELVYRAVQP